MERSLLDIISDILSNVDVDRPDGRPLHRYGISSEAFGELEDRLRGVLASVCSSDRDMKVSEQEEKAFASGFVLWAAERIQTRFAGGKLTWDFVLDPLGLREQEHQNKARECVKEGLFWWDREVRRSRDGHRLFLYTLMAEGGIPAALLKEQGLYRDVVMGSLAELERAGGPAAESLVEQIAGHWIVRLSQACQNEDFVRLVADFVLALVNLRAALPSDLPKAAAEQWLNEHRPGWDSTIPLRMTPEVVESLISPALRADRDTYLTGPLCRRQLWRDEMGHWRGYLIFQDNGWVPLRFFSNAKDLRLRLLPMGEGSIDGLSFSGVPDGEGWRIKRYGRSGNSSIPCSPETPFALMAFADGQEKGEAVIDPGLPAPAEIPSFWRSSDSRESASVDCLVPLSGAKRTRGPCLWLLTPDGVEPDVNAGLVLEKGGPAPSGVIWRISGKGILQLEDRIYRIETQAEHDAPEVRLIPFGETLRGWRLTGDIPVYCGDVNFYGQVGVDQLRWISEGNLRRRQGRTLGSEIIEWVQKGETLTHLRLVHFQKTVRLALHEEAPGCLAFTAEGLESDWSVWLKAGEAEAQGEPEYGAIDLKLETSGAVPGFVELRLFEPETGHFVDLVATWPARSGMLIAPEGFRLDVNRQLAIEALYGWRAVVPKNVRGGYLQLQLMGQEHRSVSFPATGEERLGSWIPLIREMLAQGGPDAQVNLSLLVSGQESSRLEMRRYHRQSIVEDNRLRLDLDWDKPVPPETTLSIQMNKHQNLKINAIDINSLESKSIDITGVSINLLEFPGNVGGPWLIQPRLEGLIQQAVVWPSVSLPKASCEDRIADYTEKLQKLTSSPEDPELDHLWKLITTVGHDNGDSGLLDQIRALVKVPEAIILWSLQVSENELSDVLSLDSVIPIFWPVMSVSCFTKVVELEHTRWQAKLMQYFSELEAQAEADARLVRRVGEILKHRRELAGHFSKSLVDLELFSRITPDYQETLGRLLISKPVDYFKDVAQDAVKRFERLPQGILDLSPLKRPQWLPEFNPDVRPIIDAPLVAAEIATGFRPGPTTVSEILALINLRLVDPVYFDAALPASINIYLNGGAE